MQQPVSTPSLTLAKLLQQITLAHDLFPLGISNQILLKLAAAQEPRPRFFRLFALWLNQTAIVDSPETLTVLLKSQDT
ncbi:MAG: hypothetical protein Q8O99_07540 [bacterium]|nr:hypothetical protein [bacterium]